MLKIRLDQHSPCSVGGSAQRFAQRRSGNSCRPQHHGCRNDLVSDTNFAFANIGDHRVYSHFDAKLVQLAERALLKVRRKRRQHSGPAFNQQNACLRRINVLVLGTERHARDLAHRPGQFNSGRAAANHDEVQRQVRARQQRLALGQFVSQQDAAPHLQRIFEGLQSGRQRLPIIVAKVGVSGSCRDDEVIVSEVVTVELHFAAGDVNADDFAH